MNACFRLLLPASLFLLVPLASFAEIRYYRATDYGIPISEIASARVKAYPNVLIYEKNGNLTLRQFIQKGKEKKRWERTDKWKGNYTETEYEDGRPVTKIGVENDLLVREELYFKGILSEIRYFSYNQRNLSEMRVTDADGKELYTNEYLLGANGRLTRVRQQRPHQPDIAYSFQYNANQLSRFTAQEGGFWVTYSYHQGHLQSTKEQKDNKVLYYKEEYLPGVLSTKEDDYTADLHVQQYFDPSGRLLKKTVWEKGQKSIVEYGYDARHHLISEKIRSPGTLELYHYEVDGNGNRLSHTYTKNGELLRKAVYTAPSDYEETVFRSGVAVFRVLYRDRVKVKSEYLLSAKDSAQATPDREGGEAAAVTTEPTAVNRADKGGGSGPTGEQEEAHAASTMAL